MAIHSTIFFFNNKYKDGQLNLMGLVGTMELSAGDNLTKLQENMNTLDACGNVGEHSFQFVSN